jgi:hypothetical protein
VAARRAITGDEHYREELAKIYESLFSLPRSLHIIIAIIMMLLLKPVNFKELPILLDSAVVLKEKAL